MSLLKTGHFTQNPAGSGRECKRILRQLCSEIGSKITEAEHQTDVESAA